MHDAGLEDRTAEVTWRAWVYICEGLCLCAWSDITFTRWRGGLFGGLQVIVEVALCQLPIARATPPGGWTPIVARNHPGNQRAGEESNLYGYELGIADAR